MEGQPSVGSQWKDFSVFPSQFAQMICSFELLDITISLLLQKSFGSEGQKSRERDERFFDLGKGLCNGPLPRFLATIAQSRSLAVLVT